MLRKLFALFGMAVLTAAAAPLASAQSVDMASATATCSSYSLAVSASGLSIGSSYSISYTINVTPDPGGFPITGSIPFEATATTFTGTVTGSFPTLVGGYTFSGSASIAGAGTTDIMFSPASLTCGAPPPPACSAQSSNPSNFNGTPIGAGDYVWFNANFTASGIPSSGTTVSLTSATISFTDGTTSYALTVPNAQVTFSPSATCTSTTFDSMTNTWMTTVPLKGDDEIFLTGLAFPVPTGGLSGGLNPVSWQGVFGTDGAAGVSIQWKWGAAVYSSFTTNYNALAVKPGHQTACGIKNGDHAGTPEGVNNNNQPWKQFVLGGARGGGGSNWTGSWSSTQSAAPACAPAMEE